MLDELIMFIILFPLLLLILPVFIYLAKIVKEQIKKIQLDRENELKSVVAANSSWYRQAVELNQETTYYENIIDNGRSCYYVNASSKASFDTITPENGIFEFLDLHKPKVERALEQVHRNRVIREVYIKKFNSLRSSMDEVNCKNLGIRYEKFIELEKEIVSAAKLRIVDRYTITCYVKYVSPQGRNRYSKHKVFDEMQIRSALKELDRKNAYQSTEEWRRKNERSKVTPSLRYDVMKRDRFRCRLCGRSADSGVELEVDHIIPVSKGGGTTYSNLQTLCRDCNRGKGAKM